MSSMTWHHIRSLWPEITSNLRSSSRTELCDEGKFLERENKRCRLIILHLYLSSWMAFFYSNKFLLSDFSSDFRQRLHWWWWFIGESVNSLCVLLPTQWAQSIASQTMFSLDCALLWAQGEQDDLQRSLPSSAFCDPVKSNPIKIPCCRILMKNIWDIINN